MILNQAIFKARHVFLRQWVFAADETGDRRGYLLNLNITKRSARQEFKTFLEMTNHDLLQRRADFKFWMDSKDVYIEVDFDRI